MQLQCPYCGKTCETEQELAVGQHVICPFCNVKFSYGESNGKTKKEEEVLIYCPKCTRQIVWEKSLLNANCHCPYCSEDFVAKLPKWKYESRWRVWIVAGIFLVSGVIGQWLGPELLKIFSPAARDRDAIKLCQKEIRDYMAHFRKYGQTIRESGVLDLYLSSTQQELKGEVSKEKYRCAIESALHDAKVLNSWCKGRIATFDPDGTEKKVLVLKNSIREVYRDYVELTTIGIELFKKTLECHQVCSGMLADATSFEKRVMENYLRNMKDEDNFGRRFKRGAEEKMKEAADSLCLEVYFLHKRYFDAEEKMLKDVEKNSRRIKEYYGGK